MLVAEPVQERLAFGELVVADAGADARRDRRTTCCKCAEHLHPVAGGGADVAEHALDVVLDRGENDRDSSRGRLRCAPRIRAVPRRRRFVTSSLARPRSSTVRRARRTRRIGCTTRWRPRSWRSSAIVTESTTNGMSSFTMSMTVCPCGVGHVDDRGSRGVRPVRAAPVRERASGELVDRRPARGRRDPGRRSSGGRTRRHRDRRLRSPVFRPRAATRSSTVSASDATMRTIPVSSARTAPPVCSPVDIADALDARAGARRRGRRASRWRAFGPHDLQVDDQARPHAGERGGRAVERAIREPGSRPYPGTRCSARSSTTTSRTTPSTVGSSTRSTAPRTTCAASRSGRR